MDKTLIAVGLMSGTSMDGIDASIIRSNGEENIDIIGNLYLKYDSELKSSLQQFCKKILSRNDLKDNLDQYNILEREITIKHAKLVNQICKKFNSKPNIIGFHGQTILHKPEENYSIQIGNAKLLSQLSSTDVIYQFRKNDLDNGGHGAPLTPIYHYYLKQKLKLKLPLLFLNIGGIANYTFCDKNTFFAADAGPGNCLMDSYAKEKMKLDFDKDGNIAASGKIDNTLINNILDHYNYNFKKTHSLDIKDFDINFVRGLSTEDAFSNLNFFSAKIISENIKDKLPNDTSIILCGGGRKNKTLVSNLKKFLNNKIYDIDVFGIDGDFIESQAFAYLSIRSLYKKNITFPETTKVQRPLTGGILISYI